MLYGIWQILLSAFDRLAQIACWRHQLSSNWCKHPLMALLVWRSMWESFTALEQVQSIRYCACQQYLPQYVASNHQESTPYFLVVMPEMCISGVWCVVLYVCRWAWSNQHTWVMYLYGSAGSPFVDLLADILFEASWHPWPCRWWVHVSCSPWLLKKCNCVYINWNME